MKPFGASVAMGESLLVTAHAPARFWTLHLGNGCLGYAHDQSTKHPEHERRIDVAHSAPVLIQRHIQRMVQLAFNDPIAALEFDPAQGVEFFERQAAD